MEIDSEEEDVPFSEQERGDGAIDEFQDRTEMFFMLMKCEELDCNSLARFNYPNETVGRFCASHKTDEMVNLSKAVCKFEGCFREPHFNYPELTETIYCTSHKAPGMIDVKNKVCESRGCDRKAWYNTEPLADLGGRLCKFHAGRS
eukprot:CAMPEP_0206376372 /NCGR_PEP_ID=MMETSP0294-20121207/9440_1 /ASSEMBLY_ACC=CAM_ASM_000327 /TAXON_ID=39354 /ORGANISM="Heterosigma akashiwo, Strain CCMP2393" /LENGTH=145 /DNA_ID=CAMNT_0053824479 /DNA_START=167 /DNA_END=601 /DNA_ORIENTATION=+